MDILNLVNKIEELFSQGRSLPFTHNVVINEDQMIDLIDQMRISIPEEIKRSQQILAQRDRILAQAKDEHDRMLEIAFDGAGTKKLMLSAAARFLAKE